MRLYFGIRLPGRKVCRRLLQGGVVGIGGQRTLYEVAETVGALGPGKEVKDHSGQGIIARHGVQVFVQLQAQHHAQPVAVKGLQQRLMQLV